MTKRLWPWIFATPFLLVLFEYLAVAPVGSRIFLSFKTPFILALLVAMIAVIVMPFLLMVRDLRKPVLPWLFVSICFLPLAFGGINLGAKARHSAFHNLAERSTPLVAAITRYVGDHGSPPQALNELVPDYLNEIPKTGIMAYPEYTYEVGEGAERYEGNPWILSVFTPSGGINFDQFLYFPLQNYPDQGYGGLLERVGDWAYLHE